MATSIGIPKLGVAMTEGTVVEWLAADGDAVAAGQVLYRLETDKVENDIEAPVAGTLRIVIPEGGPYPVGTVVGEIS